MDYKLPSPVGAHPSRHQTAPRKPYSVCRGIFDCLKGICIALFILHLCGEPPSALDYASDYASDLSSGTFRWPWTPRSVKTNVILLISDGYGPASVTFTRHFAQALNNDTDYNSRFQLPLDTILAGTHRSRSSSSLITDSAAGATAFSCAKKSYNGAIGVTPDGKACGTVFEAAKRDGLLTGVVVTSRLTDATPAAFISHAASRAEEPLIASQLIGGEKNPLGERTLDLAIGGGGCAFLPKSSFVSCREDDEDTVEYARKLGWDVRLAFPSNTSADDLYAKMGSSDDLFGDESSVPKPELPFMALLSPGNTPYEIDRVNIPSPLPLRPQSHYAQKAIDLLHNSKQNGKGFVLMIEGSQIDLCAHNNDPACHAREALAYHETIAHVKAWVSKHNNKHERSLLISTSDHETGGITLGRQLSADYPNYAYYPERLLNAKHSTPILTAVLIEFVRSEKTRARNEANGVVSESLVRDFIREKILGGSGLGFEGEAQGGKPTEDEVESVWKIVEQELLSKASTQEAEEEVLEAERNFYASNVLRNSNAHTASHMGPVPGVNLDGIRRVISDIAARRAEIGFSTSGHTGIDINVYAYGAEAHQLAGNQDNTNIGKVIKKFLNLDLDSVTRDLNSKTSM